MNDIIFKTLLLKGEAGNNIIDIKKTSSNGLVDTYTITRTDGVTTTFEVTNGKSITDIKKTGSTGLVDNYKINYNDGTSSTFSIGNGRGISGIKKTGSTGLVDTYTTTYNDGTTSTFTVTNGKDGKDGGITVDDALSETSTNPVQNKVITNSINDVTSKLQNLQVGGRNLIKNSKGEFIIHNNTSVEKLKYFYVPNEEMLISDNTTVTISADIKTNGHVKSMEFVLHDNLVKNVSAKAFDNLPTTYTRLSVTFTTQLHIPGEDWSFVVIRFDNNATDSEGTDALLYIRNPKLEIGNIATDWTPAPEDLADTPIPNSDIDTILNS